MHPSALRIRTTDAAVSLTDAFRAGHDLGRAAGYEAGYADGFATGADVGAWGILLHLGPAVDKLLNDRTPYTGAYLAYRTARDQPSNRPCPRRCGKCTGCMRAATTASNQRFYGTDDYPGAIKAARRIAARKAAGLLPDDDPAVNEMEDGARRAAGLPPLHRRTGRKAAA